ncbi:hypothetical protein LR013_04685, partial [candidate division NPL-UPA2 bacterium]|nr:hypothetical protein [candidate division NPL-UPA2 bacterium]
MTKKRVIFVMAHSPNEDIRLFKEAKALKHSGYLTSIIYWNREGKSDGLNNIESYDEKLCLRFKAPYGMLVLLFLPVWWSFVFFSLLVKKWDIVHALNFYSIIPSLIAGKLKRKLVIYEILDIYKWVLPI